MGEKRTGYRIARRKETTGKTLERGGGVETAVSR
jgi:hypothetical protein